jgi:hypothetical protein
MYCPRCRDEYREGFTWCPDCDTALVDGLPRVPVETNIEDRETQEGAGVPDAEQEDDDESLVPVGQYFNAIEAHGHRMALEQAGLRAWVCDENIGATYGVGIGTKLQVRAGDEAAARAILEMDSAAASADLWSDLPDEVVEPPEAVAPTRPEPEVAPEEPSVEKDRRFETLELVAVVLVTCASPIFWNMLRERDLLPSKPGELLASIPWYAGLTLVIWILLRRRRAALSPRPLPRGLPPWVREIFTCGMLFFAVWILDPVISGLLRQMGVLLAAALFAIPHGYPPNSTLTVFAFGVVLGWVYLRSRSLPRLVIAHWIFNLAVMNRYLHD